MEAEGETKTKVDEVKESVAEQIGSVVKPLVEEVTQAAKSLVENVNVSSSDVENEVEKLVSDPWSSLKSLGDKFNSKTEETLPTSDENVGETSEAAKNVCGETVDESKQPEKDGLLDEKPRSTNTQPFVALIASERASWMNCCGLIDVLKRSDQ